VFNSFSYCLVSILFGQLPSANLVMDTVTSSYLQHWNKNKKMKVSIKW